MICEAVAVLPQASVAVNVLVTEYSLAQEPGVVTSVLVIDTVPQASLAVGVPKLGVSGHSIVAAAGTEVNTGAVLIVRVTSRHTVAVLQQASERVNDMRCIISISDQLACCSRIITSIRCSKCSCNRVFISARARSCYIRISDRYSTAGITCCWCTKAWSEWTLNSSSSRN